MSKYIFYSSSICPFSRKVKFFLDEFPIEYQEVEIKYWEKNKEFLKLNHAGETPVLKDVKKNLIICDSYVICEYLNLQEMNLNEINYFNMFGLVTEDKYEIKRLEMWFDKKFYNEVTKNIINEYFIKTFTKSRDSLNMPLVKQSLNHLVKHIEYIEFLLEKRKWLASDSFSIADIAAVSQLSIIDYLGFIAWNKSLRMKEWYISTKQKIGFRKILDKKIIGFEPSQYYKELDF